MKILGIKIDNLTKNQVFQKIDGFLKDDQQHYIVLLYSNFIVQANKDRYFQQIINKADLSLCDGKGLLFAAKFLNYLLKEQISGVELVKEISNRYSKIFLFGGTKESVEKAAIVLGSNIIGKADGYEDMDKVIGMVNQIQPEILLVALGMPKQEKWINENLKKMPSVKLAIGVGGAFDFISGKTKRAPRFLQSLGLEWLWRFIFQPWRIRRVFNAVIIFPWLVLKSYYKDVP
ncbi:WecB/TagA/CpsF family glycosyltransferase [Patescibacteria group bacterium]|nr:WecB/TagA/CpsF family glycosyltransferase [Patescibacteria group bacterium]MBU2472598.1 WecB/TagA/CpsF family glycosyltransferase [Patescibacteria group bacterium]